MAPFFSFASFGGGIASKLLGGAISFSATGGTQFEPGNGYQYIIFTSPGTLTVTDAGPGLVDIIVVGGGGGGGNGESAFTNDRYGGGGGGAGGYGQHNNFSLPVGEYDISIGDGGGVSPSTYNNQPGPNRTGDPGNPSSISGPTITTLIAYGGGAGGGSKDYKPTPPFPGGNLPADAGEPGGSGGGGGGGVQGGVGDRDTLGNPIPAYLQGDLLVQGYTGSTSPPTSLVGGGGGGAGATGTAADSIGGIGRVAWSGDDGIPPSYGTPGPTPGRWFAGGGGGGAWKVAPSNNGGAGGGGQGADDYSANGSAVQDSTSGTTNTGGGGGGGNGAPRRASPGGSGIVIIRALA